MKIRAKYVEPSVAGHPLLSLDRGETSGNWVNKTIEYWLKIDGPDAETAASIIANDPDMLLFNGAVRTTWPHEREHLPNVGVTILPNHTVTIALGPPKKIPGALWQGPMAVLNRARAKADLLTAAMPSMESLLGRFVLLGYDMLQKHPAIKDGVNGSLLKKTERSGMGNW